MAMTSSDQPKLPVRAPSRAAQARSQDLAVHLGRGSLPVELRDAAGMARLDYILGLSDPSAFIQGLATEELYLLYRDIGRNDSYQLLELASDEQLAGIVDIDAWDRDRLVPERYLRWLAEAKEGNPDTPLRLVAATDSEVLMLLFMGDLQIHAKDLDIDTVSDDYELHTTPDGEFYVTIPRDHEQAQSLRYLMKVCWAADQDRMRDIFQAARFELQSAVEESAHQFRRGRLEDLGFVSQDEALEVFGYQDPQRTKARLEAALEERDPFRPTHLGDVAFDLTLSGFETPTLLAAAMAQLDDEARASFGQAMTFLVNKVFVASTGDLSRVEELPEAGRSAAALVNLGLASVAGDSVPAAARLLAKAWPEELFRLGNGLTVALSLDARRLRSRAGTRFGLSLFGQPDDDTLAWVAQPRPRYYEGLSNPASVTPRPFTTLAEVAAVRAIIDRSDAVLQMFEAQLGFTTEALLDSGLSEETLRHIRLGTLFRTGLAHALLEDSWRFDPLTRNDLVAFLRLGVGDGELTEALSGALEGIRDSVDDLQAAWIDGAMEELVETLGEVASEDVDPRFATELFVCAV